jgi:hypothetical protein
VSVATEPSQKRRHRRIARAPHIGIACLADAALNIDRRARLPALRCQAKIGGDIARTAAARRIVDRLVHGLIESSSRRTAEVDAGQLSAPATNATPPAPPAHPAAATAHDDDRFIDEVFCRSRKILIHREWSGFGCTRQHGQSSGGDNGTAKDGP